jgi:hypothetical protein
MKQLEITIKGRKYVIPYLHRKDPIIDDSLSQPGFKMIIQFYNQITDQVYFAGTYEAVSKITDIPIKVLLKKKEIIDWEFEWRIFSPVTIP